MLITKISIRILTSDFNWLDDIEPIQVVECGFSKVDDYGQQYYVDGFFGMSKKYASWDDAMEDTARRCGFTFVNVYAQDEADAKWNEMRDAMAQAHDNLGWTFELPR